MTHGDGYDHANGANIDDNDDRDNDEAEDVDDGSGDDNDNDNYDDANDDDQQIWSLTHRLRSSDHSAMHQSLLHMSRQFSRKIMVRYLGQRVYLFS